jgi:crossover junction endodeoxyribonuclease RusA
MVESSKAVRPWRQDVRDAALKALSEHGDWPAGGKRTGYQVTFEFVLYRPQAVPKAHPGWTNTGPDISKLTRSTEDALTEAGVYPDDRCIFEEHVSKRLADPGEPTGCHITVEQVTW